MDTADIQLIYEYDRWANHRCLAAASAVTQEQFTRDLGGSFPSIRDTLVHLIGGEWLWINYWSERARTPEFLAEQRKQAASRFDPRSFPDAAAVQAEWIGIEREQVRFLERLTEDSLDEWVPFRTTQVKLVHLMQHLANHSTYHRGQVALMVRMLGRDPRPTDFHVFLIEGREPAKPKS